MNSSRILIVEDHDAERKLLSRWLSSIFTSCEFTEASSGEEAIEQTIVFKPHIILMDIDLPKMNGIETVRTIKKTFPKIPCVMLSIHDDSAHRNLAMNAGAAAYVAKQDLHRELISVLETLIYEEGKYNDAI